MGAQQRQWVRLGVCEMEATGGGWKKVKLIKSLTRGLCLLESGNKKPLTLLSGCRGAPCLWNIALERLGRGSRQCTCRVYYLTWAEVLGGNGARKVLQAFTQHIYIVNKEVLQLLGRTSARSYCLVNNEPWEQNLLTYSIRHSCALAMMMSSPWEPWSPAQCMPFLVWLEKTLHFLRKWSCNQTKALCLCAVHFQTLQFIV